MANSEWANSDAPGHTCSHCGFLQSAPDDTAYPDLPTVPQHLLTTNDAPSDVEATEMRDIMDAARARIADLDISVAALEHLLKKVQAKRRDARMHLHRTSSILHVRCLPDDVLGEIFSHTVGDEPHHRPIVCRSPWVLGRVCSRWRSINLSLSTLWSNIDSGQPLPIAQAHLERSNACGLKIRLGYVDARIIGLLTDCSSRWETVDLGVGMGMLPILDRINGRVPMLRELKYHPIHRGGPLAGESSCRALQVAPKLSRVTITGYMTGAYVSLHLPWPQITRLQLQIFDTEGLSQLASACNLGELSLTGRMYSVLSSARPPPRASMIELPCLHTLSVEDGEFLDFLILPVLEDICVSRNAKSLPSLIDRSLCSIRTFTGAMEWDYLPFQDLVPILDRTPKLLEMRLGRFHGLVFLAAHLTIPSDCDTNFRAPCPELRAVCFWNITAQRECSLVVEMVESRAEKTMCSALSLSIHTLGRRRLNAHECVARDRLSARGTNVEWLCLRSDRMDSWKNWYP
ncbi:hypothetical protein B0H17DRAFT_1339549 [Mycena rosella]|uniref:F-box domain-containing protein n=1 Tax=Mycena rosella TaxID=1033263 RepID=A0AAD7FU48_MYCRO|nr:hypothetical protein B0H17DRAFT_1339549 [Mycena rosella]